MVVAIKVIHSTLTNDFGFKNILWVFSGRRGVHCWVCDEEARKLGVQGLFCFFFFLLFSYQSTHPQKIARAAIVDYLTVIGGEGKTKKVHLGTKPLHPAVRYILFPFPFFFFFKPSLPPLPSHQQAILPRSRQTNFRKTSHRRPTTLRFPRIFCCNSLPPPHRHCRGFEGTVGQG